MFFEMKKYVYLAYLLYSIIIIMAELLGPKYQMTPRQVYGWSKLKNSIFFNFSDIHENT